MGEPLLCGIWPRIQIVSLSAFRSDLIGYGGVEGWRCEVLCGGHLLPPSIPEDARADRCTRECSRLFPLLAITGASPFLLLR